MSDRPRYLPRALTPADVELVRRAFPRNERDEPVCILGGEPRDADKALCRDHWFALIPATRRFYLELGLLERARFLVDMATDEAAAR